MPETWFDYTLVEYALTKSNEITSYLWYLQKYTYLRCQMSILSELMKVEEIWIQWNVRFRIFTSENIISVWNMFNCVIKFNISWNWMNVCESESIWKLLRTHFRFQWDNKLKIQFMHVFLLTDWKFNRFIRSTILALIYYHNFI